MTTSATTLSGRPAKAPPRKTTIVAAAERESLRKDEERQLAQHIGHVIRQRRKQLGWSQTQLADIMGISFQQIQKYEKGTNRTSSPTLLRMSQAMNVPIDFFFPRPGQSMEPMVPTLHTTTLERLDLLSTRVGALAKALEDAVEQLKAAK